MLKNHRFSRGYLITQTKNLPTINAEEVVKFCTFDEKLKKDCEHLRNNLAGEQNKDKRKVFKKNNLPYVCFAGVFKERKNAALLKPSGLMGIDYDVYDNDASNVLREILKQSKYTYILKTSPSNGLHQIIKIPLINSEEEYKQHFYGFLREHKDLEIDEGCSDISRAFYLSHDPRIWINDNAEIFDKKGENVVQTRERVCNNKKKHKGGDRSAYDFAFCCKLIRQNKTKEDIFRIMDKCGSERWKSETLSYKNVTYNNASKVAGGSK